MFSNSRLRLEVALFYRLKVAVFKALFKAFFDDIEKKFMKKERNLLIEIGGGRILSLIEIKNITFLGGIDKRNKNKRLKLEVSKVAPLMKLLLFKLHGRCSYGEKQSFNGNIGYG